MASLADEVTAVDLDGDELDRQRFYHDRDFSDGLPIVVPEQERVEEFVAAAGFDPARVVGALEPQRGVATVANVAVNAVLAGCRPNQLGIVLAAVEAMADDEFNLRGLQTTTNPAAPLCVVNGEARHEAGVASGSNALAPGQHANGPIGRAIRFVMRNVGGAVGEADRGTLGSPAKYTYCLAEAEEVSPWEPLHVARGYNSEDSVVTMFAPESFLNTTAIFDTAEPILHHVVRAMRATGTNLVKSRGTLLVIFNPGHAQQLHREGYDRRRVREYLFEHAKVPLSEFPDGNIPQGSWTVEDGRVLVTDSPEAIEIMVAGGGEPMHNVYLPGLNITTATSRRVWSPDRS